MADPQRTREPEVNVHVVQPFWAQSRVEKGRGEFGGINGKYPVRLAHTDGSLWLNSILLGFWVLFILLKMACFSTDKESLALRNDWLNIDLAWGDVAQSVARWITVGF